jgi:hypothetical protein
MLHGERLKFQTMHPSLSIGEAQTGTLQLKERSRLIERIVYASH